MPVTWNMKPLSNYIRSWSAGRSVLFVWALLLPGFCRAQLGPTADLDAYQRKAAPVLKKFCMDCHSGASPEGKFSVVDLDPDLLKGPDLESWRMVDDQVRFGDMPPADADQPTPSERAELLNWIRGEALKTQLPGVISEEKLLLPQFGNYVDHLFLFGERQSRVYPAYPRLWRLRPEIYGSLAPKLVSGAKVTGLANALNELDGSEFKDYAAAYFLDEASTQQLFSNAKKIAEAQISPQSRDRIFKELAADDASPSAEDLENAISTAFRKALGRGPTAEEQQRFAAFYHKTVKVGGHRAATRALLMTVLLQPEFMFRQELGDGHVDEFGRMRLTPREVAFALSYALADEPLEVFLNKARDGNLSTNGQLAEAVRLQLNSGDTPRLREFFREFFNHPVAEEVFKDEPEGGDHDPAMLIGDLEMTMWEIVDNDEQVLANLLTTRKYYVNATYGKDDEAGKIVVRNQRSHKYQTAFNMPIDWKWGAHLQPLNFSREDRAGVLTHPAWLVAWSGNFENHPVQRGKWIRTHLLGGTVPDVPIGVDARVPEQEHTTFRDRLKLATSKKECWRCHKQMDPLGVPFERYDHYGRLQRLDAGKPVVISGEISRTLSPDMHRKVSGPTEMMDVLAESEFVEQVFVRHVFRFLMGRNESLGDANTLQDAHHAYRQSGGSFKALVVSILSSDSFLLRQVPSERIAAMELLENSN